MRRGYTRLWRKFEGEVVFQNPGIWKLWTWLLMHANHKRITIPIVVGRVATTATLEPGQVLIGRHSLAKTLKMPPSTIRNRLHFLEEHEYVDIKKDKHYSIVTICDWDGWVKYEEKKRTTKRTSRGQAEDTEDHSYHDESGGRDSSGSEIVDLTV